ncbi:MAG: hypothetical protein KAH32_06945 [Chlamydiia bacterium]|nr:hypothetical protein [Chlamydiia bacterium]
MKKHKVMLGSDPELLLTKTVGYHTMFFPIIGLIGHGKHDPLHLDDSGFRTFQEDNVALEYTTHPTSNKKDWVQEQSMMYNKAVALAESYDLKVSTSDVAARYAAQMLKSKQASTFGCEATWNCYTNSENRAPNTNTVYRSAGGHVHISYDDHTEESNMELVRLLDAVYVTLPSNIINLLYGSHEAIRRESYGKAGEARLKSYGVEWRVLSNKWVHSPKAMAIVWGIVEKAFSLLKMGVTVDPSDYGRIISHIDNVKPFSESALKRLLIIPTGPSKKASALTANINKIIAQNLI